MAIFLPQYLPMEANKQERETLKKALSEWEQAGLISPEKSAELERTITPSDSGMQVVARYFFFIALSCIILAFAAIFIDEKFLEKVKAYFAFSNLAIAGLMLALSITWFWYIAKRRQKFSEITYEIYMVVGALATLCTLVYVCKDIGFGSNYTGFLFATSVLLGIMAVFFRSNALWVTALLSLMGWFGTFSDLYAIHNRFLGMNYPLRFTLFGLLLIGFSFVINKIKPTQFTARSTYVAAMIIFFTGLWGVSVFGNFSDLEAWSKVRQVHVLAWSIVFAAAALTAFIGGIKYKDDFARDMGVLFLLLNLYSRYFEYFWDTVNKGIFFLILAVSFFFIGRWIEKKKKTNGKILP
jgi:hypothetical protein